MNNWRNEEYNWEKRWWFEYELFYLCLRELDFNKFRFLLFLSSYLIFPLINFVTGSKINKLSISFMYGIDNATDGPPLIYVILRRILKSWKIEWPVEQLRVRVQESARRETRGRDKDMTETERRIMGEREREKLRGE